MYVGRSHEKRLGTTGVEYAYYYKYILISTFKKCYVFEIFLKCNGADSKVYKTIVKPKMRRYHRSVGLEDLLDELVLGGVHELNDVTVQRVSILLQKTCADTINLYIRDPVCSTNTVIRSTAVAIAQYIYGSKLYIFILCQKSLGY